MQNNIYDAQFRGNILIAGKTGCGKTYFLQKFGLNNFFGRIVKSEWVLSIPLFNNNPKTSIPLCLCFSHYNTR